MTMTKEELFEKLDMAIATHCLVYGAKPIWLGVPMWVVDTPWLKINTAWGSRSDYKGIGINYMSNLVDKVCVDIDRWAEDRY